MFFLIIWSLCGFWFKVFGFMRVLFFLVCREFFLWSVCFFEKVSFGVFLGRIEFLVDLRGVDLVFFRLVIIIFKFS